MDGFIASLEASGGSVDLRPNVIRGKARLTNQNPDILALLEADPWHTNGYAVANSTTPGGYNADTYHIKYTSPTEFTFEMLVEAAAGGEDGVVYNVGAVRGLWYVGFPTVSGVRVKPRNLQPEPTDVELTNCLGVVQVKLGTDESCETTPTWANNPWLGGVNTFWNAGWLTTYVHPGASGRANLYYSADTSGGTAWTWVPVEWNNVQCDQVVRICKVPHVPPPPPPPPAKGSITGPVELLGETLHYRYIVAHHGPQGAAAGQEASGASATAPINDPSKWWKLGPVLAGDYYLYARGFARSGREFTIFDTPYWMPENRASVLADQTTPVTRVIDGETRYPFVMRPSYFYGAVRLADPYVPLHPGSTSTLQTLYFTENYDSNGDGLPDHPWNDSTRLSASTPAQGFSASTFPGSFEPGTGEFSSNYEQLLPHPYDLPYTWTQSMLRLRFWSEGASFATRPGLYDVDRFRSGRLDLAPNVIRSKLMAPEERHRIDHEYCFNEVQLFYRTDLGRFYNPVATVSGSFNGTDWRGQAVSYAASGLFFGDPFVDGYASPQSYARPTGLLSMTLPQGTFTIAPSATMVNDAGDVNGANFAPLSVSLGCGQRLKLIPPLAVIIDPINRCSAGASVPVTGTVKSLPAAVDRIWYRVNGGPEVEVCTNCGKEPTFSFTAQLQSCENTIQVFAYTEGLPEPATGSQQVVWDNPVDGPSCPGTYCLNRPPVARCKSVTVPANENCTGGCGSVDDGSYDPDEGDTVTCTQTPDCPYTMGTQRVTLSCSDKAGNTSFCEATVTVKDMVPPTIACPAEPVLACTNGGAQASFTPTAQDHCGGVITACSPASGTSFPVGTTTTVCTAFDEAGNRASCSFGVTVRDEEPPEVTCPEPSSFECDASSPPTPPAATATDVCKLASVQPSATSFPLGTSTVTYTATDVAGHQATCSTSVTVTDTQPPVLALNGSDTVTLECGIDTYTEPGAGASDICFGDLSAQVQVSGTVNSYIPGSYTLTYSVKDGAGLSTSATRTVEVVKGPTNCCKPNAGHFLPSGGTSPVMHQQHTATLLADGRVLAIGDWNNWLLEGSVYEPLSGMWTRTGKTRTTHRLHTATLLQDGRVLVAGGNGASASASAEVYDPSTNSWSPTGNLLTHRREHAAVRLPDGRVLVMGGTTMHGSLLALAEVYDPTTGTWTATGRMTRARRGFTATLLPNGRVLVAGGLTDGSDRCWSTSNCSGSAEVYDPAMGTWTATGEMTVVRGFHAATLLANGKVLVSGGGKDGEQGDRAELYDPVTGTWSATGNMLSPRRRHTLTALPNGQVLAVGGHDVSAGNHASAELYNPLSGTWCTTGSMGGNRYGHTATLLPNGRVLITAGFSDTPGYQYTSEVYDLAE